MRHRRRDLDEAIAGSSYNISTWSRFFDASVNAGRIEDFEEELQRRNRVMLPGMHGPGKRRIRKNVLNEVAERVYGSPAGVRRFAERVRERALGDAASWVYFVGRGAEGPVKIGVSTNPKERMRELQVSCDDELILLGAVRGDSSIERMLHSVFERDRIRGEWFRRSEQLVTFLYYLTLTIRSDSTQVHTIPVLT